MDLFIVEHLIVIYVYSSRDEEDMRRFSYGNESGGRPYRSHERYSSSDSLDDGEYA